jgi:hypothetical protein
MRDEFAVPPEAKDPGFGMPNSRYVSLRDETAARAEHAAHQYRIDNARVLELLNEEVGEHKDVKTWIKLLRRHVMDVVHGLHSRRIIAEVVSWRRSRLLLKNVLIT